MNITYKSIGLYGPTIHSNFKSLPFPQISSENESATFLDKPLLCLQTPSCMKIVGNIHEFESAQEAGVLTKPAHIIENLESTVDLIKIVAEYYAPLNLIEQSRLLLIAQQLGFPLSRLTSDILPILNYPPQKKFVEKLLELNKLPESLQLFIVEKNISLKRTQIIQRIADQSEWATSFLKTYSPGINVFLEIIQNLWEISKRDDIPLETLLKRYFPTDTRPQSDDIKSELHSIRQQIHEVRYPLLTTARNNLNDAIEQATQNHPLKIDYDPNFERQGIDIKTHIKNENELNTLIQTLDDKAFRKLFEMI